MSGRKLPTTLLATSVLITIGLGGCGADSSPPKAAAAPPSTLLQSAASSLKGAGCYHVHTRLLGLPGNGSFDGDVTGNSARGRLLLDEAPIDVVRIGHNAFFYMSAAFLNAATGTDYPRAWEGRWLLNSSEASSAAPGVVTSADLVELLTPAGPVSGHEAPAASSERTVELRFRDHDDNDVTVHVQTERPNRPLHLETAFGGKPNFSVDLDRFGRTCGIEAPKNVVRAP